MPKPILADEDQAWRTSVTPASVEIDPGTFTIPVPGPVGHLPFTLGYGVEATDGTLHLIDPGWASEAAWRAVNVALRNHGFTIGDVGSVTLTHSHPDHGGLAGQIRATTGASVATGAGEVPSHQIARTPGDVLDICRRWGAPDALARELAGAPSVVALPVQPDATLSEGDYLDIRGRRLRVLATPGHTAGSICIEDEERHNVFTGDHVLPTLHPGIGLNDGFEHNPVAAYLASLRRVRHLSAHQVLPGHGFRFRELAVRVDEHASHVRRRASQVHDALAPELTVWDVATRVSWTARVLGERGQLLLSALRQTEYYIDFVRETSDRELPTAASPAR